MKRWAKRIGLGLLALLILGLVGTSTGHHTLSKREHERVPPPGLLVDIGGYRLHILCEGVGSPTVVMEAGLGGWSTDWSKVLSPASKVTRVCAYDRAGMGWSEVSPDPRTLDVTVEELHTLLVKAGIPGPYVLVGHSLGGMHMRAYAHSFPEDVAGLIQVDALHEDQAVLDPVFTKANQANARQFRPLVLLNATGLMALAPQSIPNQGLPDEMYPQWQAALATGAFFETTIAELLSMEGNCLRVRALEITSFGDLPLTVLSAGRRDTIATLTAAENKQYRDVWESLQPKLAALSSAGKQIIVEQSGHMIPLEQPDFVIGAVREMVDTLRK